MAQKKLASLPLPGPRRHSFNQPARMMEEAINNVLGKVTVMCGHNNHNMFINLGECAALKLVVAEKRKQKKNSIKILSSLVIILLQHISAS